ncbi:MAG: hypothetical protein WBB76_12510 [Gaiellaceae bacterium]
MRKIVLVAVLAWLLVGVGGTAATPTAACRVHDYAVGVFPRAVKNGVLLRLAVADGVVPACHLRAAVPMTIHAPGIRGNHVVWRVTARLVPWAPVVHGWIWRNWCGPQKLLVVTAGRGENRIAVKVKAPPCRNAQRRSVLVAAGPRRLPRSGAPSPAHILPPDAPPPFSPTRIRVTNGWLVGNGKTLVAVYAGEDGNDPSEGLFGIVRQNLVFGFQTEQFVPVGKTGAVRITRAPSGRAVELSAQHGDLSFTSTGGAHGVLHLATDRAKLLP